MTAATKLQKPPISTAVAVAETATEAADFPDKALTSSTSQLTSHKPPVTRFKATSPTFPQLTPTRMHKLSATTIAYDDKNSEIIAAVDNSKVKGTKLLTELEHEVNNCYGQQKTPASVTKSTRQNSTVSLNNCNNAAAAADDNTNLMDSRVDVSVTPTSAPKQQHVDVHNNVDDTNSNNTKAIVASHESNNNRHSNNISNNFSDITKRLDNNNHANQQKHQHHLLQTAASKAPKIVSESLGKQVDDVLPMTKTLTTWTTSGSGNHQINNYKIHHQHQHSEELHHHLHQQQFHWLLSSLSTNRNFSCHRREEACELASPRCQSRESNVSGGGGDGRCSSNDSQYSGNGSATPAPTPTPASPPVGLPLPATLAPAAAAALLPPQSAAMAAYFNAAAVAAQQNHLLLTNPLAAAASLVQQATQSPNTSTVAVSHSPNGDAADSSILDFSTKRSRRESNGNASDDEDAVDEEKSEENENGMMNGESLNEDINSPLDLSLGSGRKRQLSIDDLDVDEARVQPTSRKISRTNDYKPIAPGTWIPPINPYLAGVAASSLSPKTPTGLDWNGKQRIAPNEATKALEKMTEMTRLGSATETDLPSMRYTSTNASAGTNSSGGRHSAWQSHWLNKGADAVKDVFKCVWCKQSFPTLATLTTHMKETQHCGVNVAPSSSGGVGNIAVGSNISNQHAPSVHHTRHHSSTQGVPNNAVSSSSTASSSSCNKSDLNLLIKETMPLPRKLVRGQDVWLGKGAEQTRQILKCMWCGQSFRSLAEMTSHMQETQHYTNIISQEQIISWKSTDDKSPNGSVSSNGPTTSPTLATPPANTNNSGALAAGTPNSSATVSAVLTCKVCDQAFASLKELSNHMVKNAHYKEHIMRSAGETSPNLTPRGRGRQTREKRKKSLPVRKLLELERAQQDYKNNSLDPALKPLRDFAASTKISCEKCGDKIETALFVDHIRQCLGGSIMSPRHSMKSPYTPAALHAERLTSPQIRSNQYSNGRKTADNTSPISTRPDIISPISKDGEKSSSTPSVLSAIEQLIEKSFDTRARHGNSYGGASQSTTPLGSSILKRLGIDESVDYTKPLMDLQTMHFLRSYSSYSGRDRSASESSSVSERGSSRLESLTPDHNSEISRQTTPRLTPEKSSIPIEPTVEHLGNDDAVDVKIKTEPRDVVDEPMETQKSSEVPQKISVKKEFSMTDDYAPTLSKELTEQEIQRPLHTPSGSRAHSPSISERSTTPKSTASSLGNDKKINSLNALSSMFDSLNNVGTSSVGLTNSTTTSTGEANNNTAGKKSKSNPLAALQKLCEKTDPPATNARSNVTCSNTGNNLHAALSNNQQHAMQNGGNIGNMVAFSWACNDAVMTSDSIIKCSFCDTPFCSKGAYRHHLSKVHFVKDAEADATMAMKSPASSTTAAPSPRSSVSPKSNARSPAALRQSTISPAAITTAAGMVGVTLTPTINPFDESPQSKFLKYTELAKQLSSKNV